MDNELIFLIGLVSFLTGCSFTCLAFDLTKKKYISEFEAWERVNNKNFKGLMPKKKTDKENPAQKSLEHWLNIEFPDDFSKFKDYFYENCQGEDCALCTFHDKDCELCPITKFDERCNFGIWNNIYNSKSIAEANMHKAEMIALLYKIVLDEEEE